MPGAMVSSSLAAANPRHASPSGVVLDDLRAVRPLGGAEAEPSPGGSAAHRPQGLGRGHMDLGVGEVGDAADVVDVEVRRR